jgi:hypothetical protein
MEHPMAEVIHHSHQHGDISAFVESSSGFFIKLKPNSTDMILSQKWLRRANNPRRDNPFGQSPRLPD